MTTNPHYFFKRVKLLPRSLAFSIELRPGAEALVVESAEQAQAFIESAIGLQPPLRGRITYGQQLPYGAPELRAKLGSLLPMEPPLVHEGSVEDYFHAHIALRQRHAVKGPGSPSDFPLVSELLREKASALSPKQRRRVALSLALSIEEPPALFLFEALNDLDSLDIDYVLSRMTELSERGSIVTALSFNQRTASRFSERVTVIGRHVPSHPREALSFIVRVERPRELASRLASQECILSAHFDPERPTQVVVQTLDEAATAAAIAEAICETQSEIFEMVRVPVNLHLAGEESA